MINLGIVLVVSVSIIRESKVLIVQENKPQVRNTWNFPSGRIEHGEDILAAARREVKEETGYDVKLTGTTGTYNFISRLGSQVIMFHFTGEIVGGSLQIEANEIKDSRWIMVSDLLSSGLIEIREPGVMKQIADNLIKGNNHSLAFYNTQLTE
ncbi:NUDIX hydrolase [Cohnella sp. WQ 127256]|uniref:NUDIX hydrolase n=1 Tax=Cohnella sp. WQ 127256 TaxID=2938790 RepID=UPI002117328C|nr:NUDIX domain-containing protein [Cohnella sp. WQ 127256]